MSYPREGTSHDGYDGVYSEYDDYPDDSMETDEFLDSFEDEELTSIEICAECTGDKNTCTHIKREGT